MVSLFGQNPTELRLIFRPCLHYRLKQWNLYFLQLSYLQSYADAVAGKGGPLCNCFDFVDETIVFVDLF